MIFTVHCAAIPTVPCTLNTALIKSPAKFVIKHIPPLIHRRLQSYRNHHHSPRIIDLCFSPSPYIHTCRALFLLLLPDSLNARKDPSFSLPLSSLWYLLLLLCRWPCRSRNPQTEPCFSFHLYDTVLGQCHKHKHVDERRTNF